MMCKHLLSRRCHNWFKQQSALLPMTTSSRAAIFLSLFLGVSARSPIGYDAIVVLVAIELFFAFSVGFACILFSMNMFRALNRHPEIHRILPMGDFPLPIPGCSSKSGEATLLSRIT